MGDEKVGRNRFPCFWWRFWQQKHLATSVPAALVAVLAEGAMLPGARQQMTALGLLPSSFLTSG